MHTGYLLANRNGWEYNIVLLYAEGQNGFHVCDRKWRYNHMYST